MSDQEVPAPDAAEQAVPVEDETVAVEPSTDPEVPEADAIEQARVEPTDEESAAR